MPEFLGIDTSNYTTSAAVFDSESGEIRHKRKLLPVKEGQAGLRQSDALFHHVNQLSEVACGLLSDLSDLRGIGVSAFPRYAENSYMPCFLAGKTSAELLSSLSGAELFYTSHQTGHIMAALYSFGGFDLMNREFLAFHVSGGTTECLLCRPDEEQIISAKLFSSTLDLKAGQAVDRSGLMLGLKFPCGQELEKLAGKSSKTFNVRPSMKGRNCSLSGLENMCRKMIDDGADKCDTAKFCLTYIGETLLKMTDEAVSELGNIPIVFAGGVMSDLLIKNIIRKKYDAYFAEPEFSCDNAAGTAIIAAEKYRRKNL
ncbi:MAG: peptidase M22 [Porcipelethomonas sp.]